MKGTLLYAPAHTVRAADGRLVGNDSLFPSSVGLGADTVSHPQILVGGLTRKICCYLALHPVLGTCFLNLLRSQKAARHLNVGTVLT